MAGDEDPKSLHEFYHSENVRDLHRQPLVIDDIAFFGQEGATNDNGNLKYQESEVEQHLNEQYSKFPNAKKTILLSHAPPLGILSPEKDNGFQGAGSSSIKEFSPANLIISGHCYKRGGHCITDAGRKILNIASDNSGVFDGRFAIIEIDNLAIQEPVLSSTQSFYKCHPLGRLVDGSPIKTQHFINAGIKNLADINEKNRKILQNIPGSNNAIVEQWMLYAKTLQDNNIRISHEFRKKLDTISHPLVYDIETNAWGNPVWLIGVYDIKNKNFHQFFEKNSEKTVIEKFGDFLMLNQNATLISFSGCLSDKLWLLQAFHRAGLEDGTGLIKNEIDLGSEFTKKNIFGNFSGKSLRTISNSLGYSWKTNIGGMMVGSGYKKYIEDQTKPDWQLFLDHNRDDVCATVTIFNTLKKIS